MEQSKKKKKRPIAVWILSIVWFLWGIILPAAIIATLLGYDWESSSSGQMSISVACFFCAWWIIAIPAAIFFFLLRKVTIPLFAVMLLLLVILVFKSLFFDAGNFVWDDSDMILFAFMANSNLITLHYSWTLRQRSVLH